MGGLACLQRNLGHGFSENRRQDEPKMREVRAKASQERPRLDHVGAKMATWCSTWPLLDGFGVDLASIWEHVGT